MCTLSALLCLVVPEHCGYLSGNVCEDVDPPFGPYLNAKIELRLSDVQFLKTCSPIASGVHDAELT